MKFEYKILNVSRVHLNKESFQSEFLAKLNGLGQEGWELASTEGLNTSSFFSKATDTTDIMFVFKRQITDRW